MTDTTCANLQRIIQAMENEKRKEKIVNIRALIHHKFVGRIMGRGGMVAERMRQQYSSDYVVSVGTFRDKRLFHTCTTPKLMKQLWEQLLPLLFGDPLIHNPSTVRVDFVLPLGFISEVGKEGFNKIARESDTSIIILANPLPNSTEHIVEISIPKYNEYYINCFSQAIYLLSRELSIHATAALSTPGNVFFTI